MKWKHTPEPKKGEQRTRVIFALWPRICSDGYVRWLTRVKVREEAVRTYDMNSGHYTYWHEWEANPL